MRRTPGPTAHSRPTHRLRDDLAAELEVAAASVGGDADGEARLVWRPIDPDRLRIPRVHSPAAWGDHHSAVGAARPGEWLATGIADDDIGSTVSHAVV